MIQLIIARHGNTFEADKTPTRAGARTDLPLTTKGYEQAEKLGRYLADNDLIPDDVIAAPLIRTMETAKTAIKTAGANVSSVQVNDIFTEIDYGPDENKTDEQVIARIGKQALDDWNKAAIVPDGWKVSHDEVIKNWMEFANDLTKKGNGKTLVVTSNGIARFAPYITGDFEGFSAEYNIKIGTGCLCVFDFDGTKWVCNRWNVRP